MVLWCDVTTHSDSKLASKPVNLRRQGKRVMVDDTLWQSLHTAHACTLNLS
jgi:hypothetical protein